MPFCKQQIINTRKIVHSLLKFPLILRLALYIIIYIDNEQIKNTIFIVTWDSYFFNLKSTEFTEIGVGLRYILDMFRNNCSITT